MKPTNIHLAAVELFLGLYSCQIPRQTWPKTRGKIWLVVHLGQPIKCDVAIVWRHLINNLWRHWLNWSPVHDPILYISVANRNATWPSLVRLSELEATGSDNQFSQGIDRSVGTKNNLAGQDDKDRNHCYNIVCFTSFWSNSDYDAIYRLWHNIAYQFDVVILWPHDIDVIYRQILRFPKN